MDGMREIPRLANIFGYRQVNFWPHSSRQRVFRLGGLLGTHLLLGYLEIFQTVQKPGACSETKPFGRLHHIFGDTLPGGVENSKIALGLGVALLGGLGEQIHGSGRIGFNPQPFEIHHAQIMLSQGKTLFGSHGVPLEGLGIILPDLDTLKIESAQIVLSLGVAPTGEGGDGRHIFRLIHVVETDRGLLGLLLRLLRRLLHLLFYPFGFQLRFHL